MRWHYDVWIDKDLDTAVVRLCFFDPVPRTLVARAIGHPYIDDVRDDRTDRPLTRDGDAWRMRRGQRCVRYQSDLAAAAAFSVRPDVALRVGDAVGFTPDVLLLRPERVHKEAEMTMTISTWGDRAVSAPFERDERGRYRFGCSALWWKAYIAVGDLAIERVRAGGAELEVAFVDARSFPERGKYLRWLRAAADAAAQLTGRLPLERLQVLVVPAPFPGRDPVMFGMVVRGGHPGAILLVRDDLPEEVFREDWVAVHELSHLALPFVRRDDRWLSEGLATWAQQVLRARAGLLDERAAWSRFVRGLERARDGDVERVPHVYWAGAAWWLLADVHLRARGSSVDEALRPVAGCCFDDIRAESAARTGERIAAHNPAFADWLQHEAPPLAEAPARALRALRDLGVTASGAGVALDDDAPGATVRRAMMEGEGPPREL